MCPEECIGIDYPGLLDDSSVDFEGLHPGVHCLGAGQSRALDPCWGDAFLGLVPVLVLPV